MAGKQPNSQTRELREIIGDHSPNVLILYGGKWEPLNPQAIHACFSDVRPVDAGTLPAHDLFLGTCGGLRIAHARVTEGSSAYAITRIFGELHTGIVLQIGPCYGLPFGVRTGDLLIPGSVVSSEDVPEFGLSEAARLPVTGDLQRQAAIRVRPCWAYHTGLLCTVPDLTVPDNDRFETWRSTGYAGLDGESAYTIAVADLHDMQRLTIRFAAENPLHAFSETEQDGGHASMQQRGETAMYDVVLSLLDYLADSASAS